MNFLSFLKERDNNRRRSKRIVINLLYLLIPVVILANTFSSDRIITECEEIHHYNTELQEEIKLIKEEYGTSQREFDKEKELLVKEVFLLGEQRERIRLEVTELERQRDTIIQGNSDLATIAEQYREQRNQARNQRDTLQLELDATIRQLNIVRGEASQCEEVNRGLEVEISNQAAEIEEYVASIEGLYANVSELQGENDELQTLINSQASEIEECNTNIKRLNQNVADRENENGELQALINSQASEIEECNANLENLEGSLNAPATYEVNFRPIEGSSPAFSKPADVTLETTVKYTVEVNGKAVTTVCPGECEN